MDGRVQVLCGQLLVLAGLSALGVAGRGTLFYGSGLLMGMGTGLSLGRFLRMMILFPRHCERRTGYTYLLLWEAALMVGALLAEGVGTEGSAPYAVASAVSLAGLLSYQFYIYRYFTEHCRTTLI